MSNKATLRNVREPERSSLESDEIYGKILPCPICGNGIPLQLTFKRKPYLTCNDCGLQLFIRGQTGIERLQKLISKGKFIAGQETNASEPLALINRLEKLQVQKRDLETKQGLIFKNEAVSDAITVIEAEISKIEQELKARAKGKGKLKGKLK